MICGKHFKPQFQLSSIYILFISFIKEEEQEDVEEVQKERNTVKRESNKLITSKIYNIMRYFR